MNSELSKYLLYYPATLLRGEFVALYLHGYRDRQFWDEKKIKEWQVSHALRLIEYARRNSDFYADRLSNLDIDSSSFWDVFNQIPTTSKSDLIKSQTTMTTCSGRFVSSKTTGGSTGEPVTLWKNANALARERAATWRSYEWAGVTIGDPQGRFWGVPSGAGESFGAKLIDFLSNRKRVSAFELSDQKLKEYYDTLKKFAPKYLYGYVSVLELFANFVIENKLSRLKSVKSVISTSEVLTDSSRHLISQAFGVPVFNEYGCGEVGSIAHECSHGSMHIVADNLIVEVDSQSDAGEIIVTDLFNYAQPLIRYKLGDFASLSSNACSCGIKLPVLKGVHGRAYDLIHLSSGEKVHPEALMYVFEGIQSRTSAFDKFQILQCSIDSFLVRVVKNSTWNPGVEASLIQSLKKVLGENAGLKIDYVSTIERERSGKMRVVKSMLENKSEPL